AVDDGTRRWRTGSLGVAPAVVAGGALDDRVALEAVTALATPRREMETQVRVAAPHLQRVARRELTEGVLDEQVGTLVEAQIVKVDSRQQSPPPWRRRTRVGR